MSAKFVSMVIMVVVIYSETSSAMIRNHEDGSISSNSGPVNVLQRLMTMGQEKMRQKRASIGVDPSRFNNNYANKGGMSYDQISAMVDEHNKCRRAVPATNMQELKWDDQLARSAQSHADRCVFEHTAAAYRSFGENLWAGYDSTAVSAVNLWYNEVHDTQCNCFNGFKECCGHYSQVVWAETNKVGCGLANCGRVANAPGQQYLLVCHYNPAGNVLQMTADGNVYSQAAFTYRQNGVACSECPAGSYCNNGLCDVK